MQERSSGARADERESHPDHSAAIECAENLAAGVMRDYENGRGHGNVLAPDLFFQAHAGFVFGERFAVANFDFVFHCNL